MVRFGFITAFLLTAFLTAFAQNVAFVDVQKVMNQSKKGQQYKKEIESKVSYYQKKLEKIDKQIKEIEKQLASPVLSEEAKEKKRKEIAQLKAKGLEIQQQAEEELSKMKAQAEMELIKLIQKVTERYAKQHNIDLVFIGGAIGGVVYHDKAIDITDKILELVNKELK
ncbi:MAG: OmpH family outer membrane protein [Aquificae bacterium]|nr:OmpH family outer membrane protein [Aquificota bacterium]